MLRPKKLPASAAPLLYALPPLFGQSTQINSETLDDSVGCLCLHPSNDQCKSYMEMTLQAKSSQVTRDSCSLRAVRGRTAQPAAAAEADSALKMQGAPPRPSQNHNTTDTPFMALTEPTRLQFCCHRSLGPMAFFRVPLLDATGPSLPDSLLEPELARQRGVAWAKHRNN